MSNLENAELSLPPQLDVFRRSRYLLARAVIIRHLKLHLSKSCPDVAVHIFASLESDDFTEYLHTTPIHFVMSHDGSGRTSKAIAEVPEDEDEVSSSTPERAAGVLVKTLLRGIIWYFNTHNLNVALINRIEFQDSKVFTMIVESFIPPTELKLAMTTRFLEEIREKRALLDDKSNKTGVGSNAALHEEELPRLAEAFSEEDLTEADFLTAYGVSKLLKAKDCNIFMASALVLHTILLQSLPLSERRFPLITFDENLEEQINTFLNKISDIFRFAIVNPRWASLMKSEEVDTDTIDAIDGRLFRIVMQAMCDQSIKNAVPPTARPDWVTISSIVAELTEKKLSLDGMVPFSSETTGDEGDLKLERDELAVLPFANMVFDKHLECIHVETDSSISARLGAMKMYRETTHWHNYKKPLNPKLAPVEKVSKWRYIYTLCLCIMSYVLIVVEIRCDRINSI
jgi:hypothetical protein